MMRASRHVVPLAIGWWLCVPAVYALEAREVFKLAEPSIVVVLASDAKGEKGSLGSGVIVAPLEILTSCKVVESAADIVVTQGNALRKARLRFQDDERDLCQLQIEEPLPVGKPVAAKALSKELEVGQDLFLIASPRGLERTISRGMISGLREMAGTPGRLIQTDAATAGSIGGGLFDQEARLVGIVTQQVRQGDGATYAAPADWIAELAQRSADRLTEKPVATAAKDAGRAPQSDRWQPSKGDRWHYRLIDGRRDVGQVHIEVVDATSGRVRERITKDGSPGFSSEREVRAEFDTRAFLPSVTLPGGYQMIELSAYFPPGSELVPGTRLGQIPGETVIQRVGKRSTVWQVKVAGVERIRVPAGEFEAWKVKAETTVDTYYGDVKLTYQIWYSSSMQRAVKMALATRWGTSAVNSDESLELAGFDKANSN